MEVTNDMPEENTGLTQGDLAIAAFALAETFNAYLERYNEEDFGDLSSLQEDPGQMTHCIRKRISRYLDSQLYQQTSNK